MPGSRLSSSHRAEAPGFRLPAIQRSRLTGVAGGKKEAKLPAIEVTTKIAYISRATSTILPPAVRGLVIADDMVSS